MYAGLAESLPPPHHYRLVVGFGLLSEDNPSLADLTDGVDTMLDTARSSGMMTPGSRRSSSFFAGIWNIQRPE